MCPIHLARTDHGGASGNGSLGALVEVVDGHSAHERELHVSVRVNAAWGNRVVTGMSVTSITAGNKEAAGYRA